MKKIHLRKRQWSRIYGWVVRPLCRVDNRTDCYEATTELRKATCRRCLKKYGAVNLNNLKGEQQCQDLGRSNAKIVKNFSSDPEPNARDAGKNSNWPQGSACGED